MTHPTHGLDPNALEAALSVKLVGQFWPCETAIESEDHNWSAYRAERYAQIITTYLAALKPRASDRERTIEKCAVMLDDIAALCSSAAGREKEGTTTKFRLKLRARNFTEAAAAIRKLSEVSHEH